MKKQIRAKVDENISNYLANENKISFWKLVNFDNPIKMMMKMMPKKKNENKCRL